MVKSIIGRKVNRVFYGVPWLTKYTTMYVLKLAFKQEGQCLTSENVHIIVRKIHMIGNRNVLPTYRNMKSKYK